MSTFKRIEENDTNQAQRHNTRWLQNREARFCFFGVGVSPSLSPFFVRRAGRSRDRDSSDHVVVATSSSLRRPRRVRRIAATAMTVRRATRC